MSNSLLDKVLESRQLQNIGKFHPYQILNDLFSVLGEREQEILRRRFHLVPKAPEKKETLEIIGQDLQITRERVRQIENEAIQKLHLERDKFQDGSALQILSDVVHNILARYGGVMEEQHLIHHLNQISLYQEDADTVLRFLLHYLLDKNFENIEETETMYRGWKLPLESLDFFHLVHECAYETIVGENRPFLLEELHKILEKSFEGGTAMSRPLDEDILLAFLRLSKRLRPNVFDEWGLSHWSQIRPRHMNDKIYIVLKREGSPLHFRDIAEKINKANFDRKRAYAATIHNELILDDKYVLVGKGIYALREWGYEKGTVIDVIESILKEKGALSKEVIIEKVLKKRFVKRTTILLALMNKERFKRNEQSEYNIIVTET